VAAAGLLAPAWACASRGSSGAGVSPTAPNPTPSAATSAAWPLRQQAQAAGRLYGAAVDVTGIGDPAFAAAVATECGIITSENSLKWAALRPAADRFDFARGDTLRDFARANSLQFHGHTLVWHSSLPGWFSSTVTAANAERFLVEHISTVVGHYAGAMHSWDVVNEAVDPASGRTDGLRTSPWLQMLGPSYLDLAFRTAAAHDSQALLTYNEYGLESTWSGSRRDATLRLLAGLIERGVPIHALGVQGHAGGTGWAQFDAAGFAAFLRDVARLGLRIFITELDVKDSTFPADVSSRDQAVAGIYRDYLAVALAEPAVEGVITWGLSDKYTWIATTTPRSDGLAVRPLPLDANMGRKPAWDAIGAAFRGQRGVAYVAAEGARSESAPARLIDGAAPRVSPPIRHATRSDAIGVLPPSAPAGPARRRRNP